MGLLVCNKLFHLALQRAVKFLYSRYVDDCCNYFCAWFNLFLYRGSERNVLATALYKTIILSVALYGTLVAQAVRRSPPTAALGSRVRVSVPSCGFRGGRNEVWVGLSRGFSRFPLPQISFHHFSTLISSFSLHFISPCDGASRVVGRHPCYSLTYNIGASSHLIPRPDLVLDTSWGYLFIYQ